MEIELINFKKEVAKRFKRSQITEWKFPRLESTSSERDIHTTNDHAQTSTNGSNTGRSQAMMDRWKTIDNYYQKKMQYKANKVKLPLASQSIQNGRSAQTESDFETNMSKAQTQSIPKIRKISNRDKKFSYAKVPQLRETKIKDFYNISDNKNVESSRNNAQKIK